MIAAIGKNRELGLNNQLLWKLPADMRFFRQTTMGKPILVGRKTFESFGAKPLPGRKNIVITRDKAYQAEGVTVVHSIADAFQETTDAEEVMVIGGATFYEQILPEADRLYLTFVEANFKADSWFPAFALDEWQEIRREPHQADDKNPFDYTFVVYDRN